MNTFTSTRLTTTSVNALALGAVVTLPVYLTPQQYASFRYRPGDEIEMQTDNEQQPTFHCRILDIESIKTDEKSTVRVRITLRKC